MTRPLPMWPAAFVVDYMDPQSPATLAAMRSGGAVAVARYVAATSFRKTVSADEVRSIAAADLDVVTVFEWGAKDAVGGVATADRDRQTAAQVLAGIGQPKDRPLYVTVDFDPTPPEFPLVRAYFAEFAKGFPWPVGLYGAPTLCWSLSRECDWIWAAGAWPGRIPAKSRLFQRVVQVPFCGVTVDKSEILAADFGQWRER